MYRPIQSAQTQPTSTSTSEGSSQVLNKNRKRRLIPVNTTGACESCRKRRCRCDGRRPICGSCAEKGGPDPQCIYENPDGLPRTTFFKRKAEQLQQETDSLRTFIKGIASSKSRDPAEVLRAIDDTEGLPSDLVDEVKGLLGVQDGVACWSEPQQAGWSTRAKDTRSRSRSDGQVDDDSLDESRAKLAELNWSDSSSSRSQSQERAAMTAHEAPCSLAGYMNDPNLPQSTKDKFRTLNQLAVRKRKRDEQAIENEAHVHLYAHLPMSSAIRANGYPASVQERQILNLKIPVYMIQPLTIPTDSPMSRVISDFREGARLRISQGESLDGILGPVKFDVSTLIEGAGYLQDFSVPSFAANFMLTFPSVDMSIKLASVLMLTRFMRWQIAPTAENYALIPDLMKPIPAQRLIPHSSDYDYLNIPALRDTLLVNPREYVSALEAGISCNWPRDTPMVEFDSVTKEWRLTAAFEEHVSNVDNFSLGPQILVDFPELEGKVRIQDKEHQTKIPEVTADELTNY